MEELLWLNMECLSIAKINGFSFYNHNVVTNLSGCKLVELSLRVCSKRIIMLKNQLIKLSAVCVLAASSGAAMAHLNIAQEDAVVVGDGSREYKEGGSAFLDVNISHDCTNADGKHFPTTGVALLLPNGANVEGTYTANHRTHEHYGANAVMGIKQRASAIFKKTKVVRGPVESFYSHGEKMEDARALKWMRGKIDNDHYENLEFKAGFPKIDMESCVAKIKMYFPTVQYCKDGYKTAWIKTADSVYGMGDAKTRVTDTYAAYATIVRTSDLPESCGDGETVEVMPSVEDINMYLGMK